MDLKFEKAPQINAGNIEFTDLVKLKQQIDKAVAAKKDYFNQQLSHVGFRLDAKNEHELQVYHLL